jgi:hypothetical protein
MVSKNNIFDDRHLEAWAVPPVSFGDIAGLPTQA